MAAASGPARAAEYVGAGLTDVKPEDKAVVSNPQPVQVLIQFQTKGRAKRSGPPNTSSRRCSTR
ncbi:MAG: hypothetical protein WDM85_00120 [Caulobacteraceae bacterium]